jgi:hypothetical protein
MKITLLLISLLLYRAIALCPTGLIVSETATTATIEFVNQPNVTCYVNYSIYTVSIPNTGSSFNVTIRGLTPATTYYYQVNCSNGSTICATATSKINTIAPCGLQPLISPYGDHAVISWTANISLMHGYIRYGTVPYNLVSDVTSLQTITLNNLISNTVYQYQIVAIDINSQQCARTGSFNTGPAPSCIITKTTVLAVTATTAAISWSANISALEAVVIYGLDTSYGNLVAQVGPNSAIITGLTQSTLYHYQVEITDINGNECVSLDGVFTTLQPCVVISANLTDIQDTNTVLKWSLNQAATSGIVKYGLTSTYGTNISTGVSSVVMQPLVPNTTYHYTLLMNSPGGQCQLADLAFTTLTLCTKYRTFTQRQYSMPCSPDNQAGCVFPKYFGPCFGPYGVWLGCPIDQGGFKIQFTNSASVLRFIPKAGLPSKLGRSLINPISNASGTDGVFSGELLTAQFNTVFDQCVPISGCDTPIEKLCYVQLNNATIDAGCNAYKVGQIISAAQYVIGNCTTSSCQTYMGSASPLCSLNSTVLYNCLANINNNFISGIGPFLQHCLLT